MKIIKGTLKTVSKTKGLILKEIPDWYNADKQYSKSIEYLNSLKGKQVEIEVGDSGYYITVKQVEEFKDASQLKTYRKLEIFQSKSTETIKEEFNKFIKTHDVKASTPIVDASGDICLFVYYEVTE